MDDQYRKKVLWLTYSWADNVHGDVDYLAQELESEGVQVKLDRISLDAGNRLWDQISRFIADPGESDGWGIHATQNSINSEKCKEELYYALDRALENRGEKYPIVAIFPGQVDISLLPKAVSTRLAVTLTDPDWKERIKSALEGRGPQIQRPFIEPYEFAISETHDVDGPNRKYAIETRPRSGTWSPYMFAIPISEKELVQPALSFGPRGIPPSATVLFGTGEATSEDGCWFILFAANEVSPTQSGWLYVKELPSKIAFGVFNGKPQYEKNIHH
jgi:hypothetical protein